MSMTQEQVDRELCKQQYQTMLQSMAQNASLSSSPYQNAMAAQNSIGTLGALGQAYNPSGTIVSGAHTTAISPWTDFGNDLVGTFQVRRMENGFLLIYKSSRHNSEKKYICATANDLSQQFMACLVLDRLEG